HTRFSRDWSSDVCSSDLYRRAELLAAAGAAPQLLNDAVSTGLLAASETYGEDAVALLRAMVALDRHGIEPRHLRAVKQSAEREEIGRASCRDRVEISVGA